jgi:hypothetical protein
MNIPLNILFWAMEIAFCIHCLDEAVAGNGFPNWMSKYGMKSFTEKFHFWGCVILHIFFIVSIIFYEIFGGNWVLLPLCICSFFFGNGFFHVIGTIMSRKYSPGMMTSPITWIIMYFIARYSLLQGSISGFNLIIFTIIGSFFTIAFIVWSLIRIKRVK